jgi:hypothetical protein
MRFARWVFLLAGIYGVITIAPQYFTEAKLGRDYPPAVNHPEFYYGFIGVCLAWQILFLTISVNPVPLRPAMLVGVLEKISFAIAAPVLYFQHRVPGLLGVFGVVDAVWAVLFGIAFIVSAPRREAART